MTINKLLVLDRNTWNNMERSRNGAMAKVLDCDFEASKFEYQSRYYAHFQSNTLGKVMNPVSLK